MSEQSTRTVERALSLLADVCEKGSTTLADASRAVDLAPSTALRLLRTLESSGFVRRDEEGSYRAGSRLMQLGAQALGHESLINVCHDEMVGLEEATGGTGPGWRDARRGLRHRRAWHRAGRDGDRLPHRSGRTRRRRTQHSGAELPHDAGVGGTIRRAAGRRHPPPLGRAHQWHGPLGPSETAV